MTTRGAPPTRRSGPPPVKGDPPASQTTPTTTGHQTDGLPQRVTLAGDDLAARVADAWGPALTSAQRFGYRCGYRVGVFHGRAEESRRWQVTWTGVNTFLTSATRADLDRARRLDDRPCRDLACEGRCSRCIRAGVVARNRRRYASPDYPGTGHAA